MDKKILFVFIVSLSFCFTIGTVFGQQPIQKLPIQKTPLVAPKPLATEECHSFNLASTSVTNKGGNWVIVDNTKPNVIIASFPGNQKADADRTLDIIKKYGMNQVCFVKPGVAFQYELAGGQAPTGTYSGEACKDFNPETLSMSNIQGRWKIIEGTNEVFDFASNQAQAMLVLNIIKKHGFTRSCSVGKPILGFHYMTSIVKPTASSIPAIPPKQEIKIDPYKVKEPSKTVPSTFPPLKDSKTAVATGTTTAKKVPPTQIPEQQKDVKSGLLKPSDPFNIRSDIPFGSPYGNDPHQSWSNILGGDPKKYGLGKGAPFNKGELLKDPNQESAYGGMPTRPGLSNIGGGVWDWFKGVLGLGDEKAREPEANNEMKQENVQIVGQNVVQRVFTCWDIEGNYSGHVVVRETLVNDKVIYIAKVYDSNGKYLYEWFKGIKELEKFDSLEGDGGWAERQWKTPDSIFKKFISQQLLENQLSRRPTGETDRPDEQRRQTMEWIKKQIEIAGSGGKDQGQDSDDTGFTQRSKLTQFIKESGMIVPRSGAIQYWISRGGPIDPVD